MIKDDGRIGYLKTKTEYFFLAAILLISFGLNFYGLNWGLPSRWNFDQSVTTALNMIRNKSLIPQEIFHPSLYYYLLIVFITPYLLYNYLFNNCFSSFLLKAVVSWNYMAVAHPDLAAGIFICARLSSVLFSIFSVLITYLIGKVIHGNIAGLFSALILTLTMDFVNWAHIEKSVSLVNLLIILSIYYALLVFKEQNLRKNYLFSCFFGGLACSAKFNGGITLFLIPIVALWQFKKGIYIFSKRCIPGILKTIFFGLFIFLLAFFISSPNILIEANKYYHETTNSYRIWLVPNDQYEILKILFPNLVGISYSLVKMFGIPLVILIVCGFVYVLLKYLKKSWDFSLLFFFVILTIGLFALSPRAYESPDSKYLIQVIPILAIFGGVFLSDLVSGVLLPAFKKIFKIICFTLIFVSSFFYCLSLDAIFTHGDLRYHATKWVESNIPIKSNIIINEPLEYSVGIKILKDYNVYVLGTELGTKGAYSFVNGEYSSINKDNFSEIKKFNSYYVIRSCWQLRQSYSCSSLDRFVEDLVLLKSFERKKLWFWAPGIGGYEPVRIEIYKLNSKS